MLQGNCVTGPFVLAGELFANFKLAIAGQLFVGTFNEQNESFDFSTRF